MSDSMIKIMEKRGVPMALNDPCRFGRNGYKIRSKDVHRNPFVQKFDPDFNNIHTIRLPFSAEFPPECQPTFWFLPRSAIRRKIPTSSHLYGIRKIVELTETNKKLTYELYRIEMNKNKIVGLGKIVFNRRLDARQWLDGRDCIHCKANQLANFCIDEKRQLVLLLRLQVSPPSFDCIRQSVFIMHLDEEKFVVKSDKTQQLPVLKKVLFDTKKLPIFNYFSSGQVCINDHGLLLFNVTICQRNDSHHERLMFMFFNEKLGLVLQRDDMSLTPPCLILGRDSASPSIWQVSKTHLYAWYTPKILQDFDFKTFSTFVSTSFCHRFFFAEYDDISLPPSLLPNKDKRIKFGFTTGILACLNLDPYDNNLKMVGKYFKYLIFREKTRPKLLYAIKMDTKEYWQEGLSRIRIFAINIDGFITNVLNGDANLLRDIWMDVNRQLCISHKIPAINNDDYHLSWIQLPIYPFNDSRSCAFCEKIETPVYIANKGWIRNKTTSFKVCKYCKSKGRHQSWWLYPCHFCSAQCFTKGSHGHKKKHKIWNRWERKGGYLGDCDYQPWK